MNIRPILASLALVSSLHAATPVPLTQAQQIYNLQVQVANLQKQVAALMNNPVQKLAPFVSVDLAAQNGVVGPNIVFTGANIHIVSGYGSTRDQQTGLGNLIIGYDEGDSSWLQPGDRGGSHNIVIGMGHKFQTTAFSGIIQGEFNTLTGPETVVIGGDWNVAQAPYSQIFGGQSNLAGEQMSTVVGGYGNQNYGRWGLLLGGFMNRYITQFGSIVGGIQPNN